MCCWVENTCETLNGLVDKEQHRSALASNTLPVAVFAMTSALPLLAGVMGVTTAFSRLMGGDVGGALFMALLVTPLLAVVNFVLGALIRRRNRSWGLEGGSRCTETHFPTCDKRWGVDVGLCRAHARCGSGLRGIHRSAIDDRVIQPEIASACRDPRKTRAPFLALLRTSPRSADPGSSARQSRPRFENRSRPRRPENNPRPGSCKGTRSQDAA